MAGIFGFLKNNDTLNGRHASELLKQCALQNLNLMADYRLAKDGTAALGYAVPRTLKKAAFSATSRDGEFWLQVFGRLFLQDGRPVDSLNWETQLLPGLREGGDDFLRKLDGEFIFAIIDIRRHSAILATDTAGTFSLYYATAPGLFVFSTQMLPLRKLIGIGAPDEKRLGQYIGLGQILDGKTWFPAIHRLHPAHIFHYSVKGCETHKYRENIYTPIAKNQVTGLLEQIRSVFVQSVDRRSGGKGVLAALTGGLDSRATWAGIKFLNRQHDIRAVTHGDPDCRDIRIAESIAQKQGLVHSIFPIQAEKLFAAWKEIAKLGEGVVPVDAGHALPFWRECKNYGTVLLDSHGGALYRRQFMKAGEKILPRNSAFAHKFFRLLQQPVTQSPVFAEGMGELVEEVCIDAISEHMPVSFDEFNTGDFADTFYLEQISAHKYSVAANIQMNFVQVSHPFLAPLLIELSRKLPQKVRRRNQIHRYIINSTWPALQKFPLDNMGMPAPYYGFTVARYLPMIYERFLKKLEPVVNPNFIRHFSTRHFVTDYPIYLTIQFDEIQQLILDEDKHFFSFFNRRVIEDRLKEFKKGNIQYSAELLQLLSIKLAWEQIYA